jgi:hypothetical protein
MLSSQDGFSIEAKFYLRFRLTNRTIPLSGINDVAELQQWVEQTCRLIRNTPGISECVRKCLMIWATRCAESQEQP